MRAKDPSPLTLQEKIRASLLDKIETGIYRPGDQIPSENELSESYGVSRVTVRAALNRLTEEGILLKRQGKGTFVKPTVHVESTLGSGSFTETCLKLGHRPSTHILHLGTREPGPVLSELYGEDASTVIELHRLRGVDGVPCILERDYFPRTFDFLFEVELEDRSLFELVERHRGAKVAGFEDRFGIAIADEGVAALLEVDPGTPLLEVTESVAGIDGGTLYVNRQLIATERYTYVVGSTKI